MTASSPPVLWNDQSGVPLGISLDQLLYRIRRSDSEDGLIFDSVTLDDILEDADAVYELDALVSTGSMLSRKITTIERIMNASGKSVSVAASQVSSPFKRQGVINVAAIFELSDGQTVTIMFHNPDAGTAKALKPSDELISWKWLLNKKDITIVVAPERGSDVPIRQVARRIMGLAEKNSKTFARMNQKRAERLEYIDGLKGEIGELETELDSLTKQIEIANIETEDAALNAPKPVTAKEGLSLLDELRPWLSRQQYRAMADVIRNGEESAAYIDRAKVLASIIDGMAETYEQDGKGDDSTAYLHYFRGGGDWYITEKDAKGNGTEQAFGLANAGTGEPELGYIGVDELTSAGVELDLYFAPKPLSQAVSAKEGDQGEGQGSDEPVTKGMLRIIRMSGSERIEYRAAVWQEQSGEQVGAPDQETFESESEATDWLQGFGISDYSTSREVQHFNQYSGPGDLNRVEVEQTDDGVIELYREGEEKGAHRPVRFGGADQFADYMDQHYFDWPQHQQKFMAKIDSAKVNAEAQIGAMDADKVRGLAKKLGLLRIGMTNEQIREAVIKARNAAVNEEGEGEPPAEPTGKDTPSGVNEDGELEPEGAENVVKTAKGTEVQTGFTVVEAEELIASHDINGDPNPAFPEELQPRDRGRDASIAWVKKTARQLDPDSLGRTRRADTGAPIVGQDRVVESGNGRTMAIQEAYRSGSADEYREWLEEEAHHYNLDTGRIKAMKAPVLVRVRTSQIDRREFAVEANQDDKLSMTGTEKARADADRLDEALVSKLADDGNLLSAANRDFINGFLQSLGDTEAAQYMTTDGNPTGALIARVQAAIFSKAYNDDRLLELTADASKPEVANVISALNVSAPEFIRAQAADQAGTDALTSQIVDSVETSLNEQAIQAIIEATNLVRQAKANGASVEEVISQLGLFGDIPPATAAMAMFINQNNRSGKRLGVAFRAMAEFVRKEAERGQTVDMFGESQKATLEQIIAAANLELNKEYGEGSYAIESLDMFGAASGPPAPTEEEIEQARQSTDTEPTDEEKESGEYAKGDISLLGLDIAIENPKGSERSSTTQEGEQWSVSIAHDYGYIKGTKGADGDEVDVFIGPDLESERVFVINQVGKDGEFDEHKVMLGFATQEDAEQGYLSNYPAGWNMGSVQEMTVDELKAWLPTASAGVPAFVREGPEPAPNHEEVMAKTQDVIDKAAALQADESAATNGAPEAPESQEETMRRQDREFLQSVIDGTVSDIHSPDLADQILAIMERQTGDAETEEMIERAGAAYERAMLSATEEL